MRILIPAWSFYPSQEGGPSNALYWLASGLAKAGYEVRVVATNRCMNPGQVVENKWMELNSFSAIYATVERQKQFLQEEVEKCDVLIANGVCSLRNFHLNKRAMRLGKKVILSPRGELLDSAVMHKGKWYGWLKTIMFTIMRLAYGKRVLYHATSLEEEESIRKYMGQASRIVLIPNYMILPKRVEIVKSEADYLLYVGRLNHLKNIDIILKGLAKSKAFLSGNCSFKLAGEKNGEYYQNLVEQTKELGLSEKVEFLGLVTGEDKDRLYAGAKCLLLMSKSENFGNVVLEALSQGTPVIASTGTPWQALCEKKAGWWITADPDSVFECLDSLLSMNVDEYKAMREQAYAFSREFDIYSNIDKWAEVL